MSCIACITPGLVWETPTLSLDSPPVLMMSFQGLVESYYASSLGQFEGNISGQPFDSSVRNISSPTYPADFSSFKYNAGVSPIFLS